MENKCKTCNKKISDKCKKFCSLSCYHQSLRGEYDNIKNRICLQCNKPFISKQKAKKQILLNNFCSRVCRYLNQSIKQKTGNIKLCKMCNKEFYVKKCNSIYNFCSRKCSYKYRKGKYNPNYSISRAKLVSEGKINPKRNFYKQGWLLNKSNNKEEYYASSYEKKRMLQLNELGVIWTKNHKIRIPYKDKNDNIRNYVPDFLINNKIIEEIKPKSLIDSEFDNNCYKHEYAIKYCKENNLEYRIISENELSI
jgi:hypothetical protein